MISMEKQYRTRDGREVELFAIRDGRVYGRECSNGDWSSNSWSLANIDPYLVEVKPKITRTYWLVHPKQGKQSVIFFDDKEALHYARGFTSGYSSLTGPHTVEFTEGDGL